MWGDLYFIELSRGKQHILTEDEQKQSYSKKLAQQDSVISVGQILDSTANKCSIRLSTCMVNHILFNQIHCKSEYKIY